MLRIICRTCLALEGEFSSIYDSKGVSCVADMVGDITSHTPKKSDGMPEMVCLACVQEINRYYLFKIKCLNSESVLKQLLYSCQEDQDAAISDASLGKNQIIVGRACTLRKDEADVPNLADEKAVDEPYTVIDLKHENERFEIKPGVEKQKHIRYSNEEHENAANADIPLVEKESAKQSGRILPHVDTPDVEFVENALQVGKHLQMHHEDHAYISNTDMPIEKNQNPESKECALAHIDTPDIEFVETAKVSYLVLDSDEETILPDVEFVTNDKVPYVVIDSDGDIEPMETENEVDKDFNPSVRNTLIDGIPRPNPTGCILTQEQDCTQDVDFARTEDEPYVVIDLKSESERLEIKNEVQKHLQLLCSNKENKNVEIPSEHPQVDELDVELVESNKETYIVVDSEDETVQFEIQHVAKEHSTSNIIREYHPQKTGRSLLKVKNKLQPSFPKIHTAEGNSKVSTVNRQTEPNKISDDDLDYFDTLGEGESDQDCSIDVTSPSQKLQCEITREDKSTIKQITFPPFECYIFNSDNVDSAPVIEETNMTKKKNETSLHQCPVCQECFAHRLLLTHHMRLHPGGSRYYCSICKRVFSTKSSLNDHTLRHFENKPNKCEECSESFYSIEELRLHVRGHKGDSPFVCNFCQPSSTSDKDLNSDRKENGVIQAKGDSGGNDTPCSSSTQKKDQMNERVNDNFRQRYMQAHRCSICGAGFEKRKSLEIHIDQLKCSTIPFVCCQCHGQRIRYPNNIDIPSCHVCKIVLPTNEDLLKHNLEIHKVKVKSQSPIHKRNLQTMSAVKVHTRRQNGEAPYVCSVCGHFFDSLESLSQHMLQHRVNPLKWEKCPHFRRHTGGGLPYACPLCPKGVQRASCATQQQKHEGSEAFTKSCDVEMQGDSAEGCMDVDNTNAVTVTIVENCV